MYSDFYTCQTFLPYDSPLISSLFFEEKRFKNPKSKEPQSGKQICLFNLIADSNHLLMHNPVCTWALLSLSIDLLRPSQTDTHWATTGEGTMSTTNEKAHHDGAKFRNPWPSFSFEGNFPAFLKMVWSDLDRKQMTPSEDTKKLLGVPLKTELGLLRKPPIGLIQATWVGHATFLVQFDRLNVLTDPVWSNRCSPSQLVGPKRFMPVPFPLTDLPPVDVVIISHNHYDHLDLQSVKALGNKPLYLVPLGVKRWFTSLGITNVVELDWWQEHHVTFPDGDKEKSLRAVCTPCQHISGRGLLDRNKTLWCSWILEGDSKRVYFAGDTGFCTVARGSKHLGGVADAPAEPPSGSVKENLPVCPAFEEIGKRFGPIDTSFIPIGAYSPRYFMSPIHCSPEDAVGIHLAVKSKQSIGMHWGTFALTNEPIMEPPLRLKKELERLNINPSRFITMKHGETRSF